jgi:hypothetical protein
MEAGPRDNEETAVDEVERAGSVGRIDDLTGLDGRTGGAPLGNGGTAADRPREATDAGDGPGADDEPGIHEGPEDRDLVDRDDLDQDDDLDGRDGADAPPEADGALVEPQELRPQRKLRLWQLAPIVVLSALGSLMFAFPLAFEPGGGTGAVVSMLGLLICGCAAGWAVMATRRVGLSWPGLPAPDSDERPDWRIVALYAVVVGTVVVLAIWRVARLR